MYTLYRVLTSAISPLVPLILRRRLKLGKEDAAHLPERMGIASLPRPEGKLIWVHAASVGEANSVLPLIEKLLVSFPAAHVLLTTVTVTSADMMRRRLPARAMHQFAPVDTPSAAEKFLNHWHPDIALWVDSELWPNLIMEARKHGAFMGIINGRMSEKSFQAWEFAIPLVKQVLSCFSLCFAQSRADANRLLALGIPVMTGIGNLKYDAPLLPADAQELAGMQDVLAGRPVWVAASTHPGEEKIIATVHNALKTHVQGLLTIIVPRHAKRGDEIVSELKDWNIARRSQRQDITRDTDIYLADTMGELGLFYRLASVAFIGGSLVPHGGQNPLEAARIGCAIVTGPHVHNFADVVNGLEEDKAIMRVATQEELTAALQLLLADARERDRLKAAALAHVNARGGTAEQIMNELRRHIS